MRISFNTPVSAGKIGNHNGYGYGTERILASLRSLGYEVTENDGSADVGLVFNQPQHSRWFGNQYRIILHPWESTLLMPDWPGIMNEAHEVWSPSPLITEWYTKYNGITRPTYTYEHGIDSEWEVRERKVTDKIKFLHVGGEALRKEMPKTIKAFRTAFGKRDDVELLLKTGIAGFNVNNPNDNVKALHGPVPFRELLNIYYDHHIFVYPSWGEGFGFNPFQAMATGMPTIMTADWAPYYRFVDPELMVKTTMADSPWPTVHPGQMFEPNFDELVDKMRYAVDNYDELHARAQFVAPKIHEDYNWDKLTKKTFEDLENRLK